MIEPQTDVNTIIQQIRLCQLKLGSVSNRLENYELDPYAIEVIGGRAGEVSNEIQLLVESVQRLMGH